MSGTIPMVAVNSSMILEIGYVEKELALYVIFNKGAWHKYTGVSRGVYDELMAADSIGKCFNRLIKGIYQGEKTEATNG